VQRHEPLHSREPRESSGLSRRQMATCFGYRRIGVKERRFDEKGIRVSGELHDLFNISVRKGAIDNIGDLASRGDFHDLLLKQAKRESGRLLELPITPCDIDESIIVRAAKRRLLERTQPRPDDQPHGLDLVAPHVDLSPLFEGEGEHGHAVVERGRADLDAGLLEQESVGALRRFAIGTLKARAPGELRRCQPSCLVDLSHAENQIAIIALNEVPSVSSELVLDRINNALVPINAKRLLPAKKAPQQLVETGEVVHMEMRDKDVADAQELARSESPKIAKIEKQRPPLKNKIHVKPGIVEGIVDEGRIKGIPSP